MEVAAENVAEGVTICAFVGPSKNSGYGVDGGWHESLPAEGFTESATFGYILNNGGSSPAGMASYCKKLVPEVEPPVDYEYKFPTTVATQQGRMTHGLCVMGATSATVTSNSDIKYESVPDFKDDTYMWGEMNKYSRSINGGGDAKCEGGLYLRPSSFNVSYSRVS